MSDKGLGKILPASVAIEKSLLGALLQYKDGFIEIQSLISENSFYSHENTLVFRSMARLNEKEVIVDMMILAEDLKKHGELEEVGGLLYISKLTTNSCLASQLESYALILKQKELSRKQIELGSEVLKRAFSEESDPIETNSYLSDEIYKLSNLITLSKEHTNTEILGEVLRQIEQAEQNQGMTGVDTGIIELNDKTGGLQDSDLIIIAARPGMGKTALALNIAKNAKDRDNQVAVFSLEMARDQLMKRLLANDANIELDKFKTGRLNPDEWQYIHQSVGRLEDPNLIIIDDIYSLNGIISKAKVLHAKKPLKLIIIDYLQLIENNVKNGNREQEISKIARGLKMLAKTLKVPVIALSQLSRAVETRGGDKRPMLSDLRESGAIEQDADMVAFVYRASYYGYMEDDNGESTQGKAELIIAKNRNGTLANLSLNWEGKFQRFTGENSNTTMQPNDEF